jgi:hypothetical protein
VVTVDEREEGESGRVKAAVGGRPGKAR